MKTRKHDIHTKTLFVYLFLTEICACSGMMIMKETPCLLPGCNGIAGNNADRGNNAPISLPTDDSTHTDPDFVKRKHSSKGNRLHPNLLQESTKELGETPPSGDRTAKPYKTSEEWELNDPRMRLAEEGSFKSELLSSKESSPLKHSSAEGKETGSRSVSKSKGRFDIRDNKTMELSNIALEDEEEETLRNALKLNGKEDRGKEDVTSQTGLDKLDSGQVKETKLSDLLMARSIKDDKIAITNNAITNNNKNNTKFIKRLPQVIIIGVKKAGTKALLTFLSAHPDIRSHKKEVHFFDKYYERGLKWYRDQMPRSLPSELTVEKSPRYFVTGPVPKRIYEMSPRTKLLVILRDPTKRAISDFVHMKTRKKRLQVKGSFESVLFGNTSSNTSIGQHLFIEPGLYSKHLKNWFRYFPEKQLHFVNGDQMITNPSEEMEKVQKFLGLDVLVDERNFVYNSTKTFYCVYKTLVDRGTRDRTAICLGKSKGRKHPRVSERTLRAVKEFYRPHNEELYSLTGINFGWD